MSEETVLTLVTDIVTAHVSNNAVSPDQLPQLITSIYGALSTLGKEPEEAAVELKPAVSIRSSVKKDAIACLECGRKLKVLKRHLSTDHGLTIEEYRSRWSLAADYPTVAPDYVETRKALAQKFSLGRKGRTAKTAKATAAAVSTLQAASPAAAKVPKSEPKAKAGTRKAASKGKAADVPEVVAETPATVKPKRSRKLAVKA